MSHPKGVLMERAQKLGLGKPEFRTEQTGPEHEPSFLSDVLLGGEVLGTGQGGTKRTAETHAAEEALNALDARSQEGGKAKGKKTSTKAAASASGQSRSAAKPAKDEEPAKASKGVERGAAQRAAQAQSAPEPAADATDDGEFDGPWPMFDDLLASVVTVAERRVYSDLRGAEARAAIRDFSLELYKELLLGLGDLVDEDEEDEDEED